MIAMDDTKSDEVPMLGKSFEKWIIVVSLVVVHVGVVMSMILFSL